MRARFVGIVLAFALAAIPAGATQRSEPLQSLQWGLAQVRAPQAWATSTGAGARVAVVDTGADRGHEDLEFAGGASFSLCPDKPDGCGDGSWTDASYHDWHGTHVAGIVAARRNGRGIAGVAPDASLLTVEASHGVEAVNQAVRWAVRKGADVINLSLGLPEPSAPAQDAGLTAPAGFHAVVEAVRAGVVVVAAAGNWALPLCNDPALRAGVICVTGTDGEERPMPLFHRPLKPDMRALAAPGWLRETLPLGPACGSAVLSTIPMSIDEAVCGPIPRGYAGSVGTSMATPHVAGVAALLVAQCRDSAEVVDVLLRTARNPVTGSRGAWDPLYGHGIVDAAAAVAEPVRSHRAGCIVQ